MTHYGTKTMGLAREFYIYDQVTGIIKFRASRGPRNADDSAGSLNKSGYIALKINKTSYLAHRLAWLLHYGEWPSGMIDHINGDKTDNRISNLRVVDNANNQHNRSKARIDNKTKLMGVSEDRGRFVARIMTKKEKLFIGSFGTPEEAHKAYLNKKAELHPSWNKRADYTPLCEVTK